MRVRLQFRTERAKVAYARLFYGRTTVDCSAAARSAWLLIANFETGMNNLCLDSNWYGRLIRAQNNVDANPITLKTLLNLNRLFYGVA